VSIPMFHLTGSMDDAPAFVSSVKAPQRRVPFDSIDTSDQYLLIIKGADHMAIGGRSKNANDRAWQELVSRGTTAFLDKYLLTDKTATTYLDGGEFAKQIEKFGTFESKKAK